MTAAPGKKSRKDSSILAEGFGFYQAPRRVWDYGKICLFTVIKSIKSHGQE
jgi:hypothetical protein